MTLEAVPPAKQDYSASRLEPWMRGTETDLDALRGGVVHALQQALEDANRWAAALEETLLERRVYGLPSVAFQLRHIARSLDRLLTYAEDHSLTECQLDALAQEHDPAAGTASLAEFRAAIEQAFARIRAIAPGTYQEPRGIGRQRLPTTVGGLLVHCAEHTQRHVGQMITTVKLVMQVAVEEGRERS